ncbi:MAG: 2-dehydropantoate 2-reductase [Dehalococcoidales bacterium]|nr:2-dehydropantoate 2-reductase [Dehalococcoidales bacterium]
MMVPEGKSSLCWNSCDIVYRAMRIFIVGSGGVGGYFGSLLARAGADVTFLARGEHLAAIRKHGLAIRSVHGDYQIQPAQTVATIAEITDPELVILAVKTYDSADAAQQLSGVVNSNTVIISFQNGIDNDIEIKKYIENAKVFPGLAFLSAVRAAPGLIVQSGELRKLVFGDRNVPENEQLQKIEEIMRNAGIDARISDNITRDLWQKFILINAFSGMTAVCRASIGAVLSNPVTRRVYARCVREAIEVAKTLGIDIPDNMFDKVMGITEEFTPDSRSSLLVDIETGRPTEIETLNGTLVRLAEQLGIEVPVNELIYGAIKLSS